MKSLMADRRAVIFYVFAVVCVLLLIPCPTKFHFVGITLAVVYLVLGTASWLDSRGRARSGSRT